MWKALKDAVVGIAEQAGLEVPELPVDLGPVTEALGGAPAAVTDLAADTHWGDLLPEPPAP